MKTFQYALWGNQNLHTHSSDICLLPKIHPVSLSGHITSASPINLYIYGTSSLYLCSDDSSFSYDATL